MRLGVLPMVAAALCAVLVALAGLAFVAVHTTRDATAGANVVESEFAERVKSGAALNAAQDNFLITELRLRASGADDERRQAIRLAASDTRLARSIATAFLDTTGAQEDDAQMTGVIERDYERYLVVRDRALRSRLRGASVAATEPGVARAFRPVRLGLERFGDVHFTEAQQELADLRSGGRARDLTLAAMLAFAVLSLLAIVVVARGIVGRVRTYSRFAGHVAGGDLAARLQPRGRDELAALARSLNAMVEQLAAASRHRTESQSSESGYRAGQDAFSEILQVTEKETEAHQILRLHLERGVPGSRVVVLNKNNSKDRLEATTTLPDGSPLADVLQTAEPRSCLAVRLARIHETGGTPPALMACELCSAVAGDSTCSPLLVSGEVIGSVLVSHERPLDPQDKRCVSESVAQAAPILANLRNLALAEARAATDALTGLPNRRAIQDTLKRLIAHSSRSGLPLAAITLDLDHFKQINDSFGHEEGDAVLAAVGVALTSAMRQSDFVGRSGGEEFIALLPDTDAAGALEVAEKLRATISGVKLSHVDRRVSASCGVAVHPDVAGDGETLLRLADRALYAAKAGGRDRVEMAAGTPVGSAPLSV